MQRLCCFLIFCFALISNVYCQQYNFTNYSINEGLSQSVVNCIFQDSKGYIWIGTQNGLNRFDGENFEVYRFNPSDTNSLSNNWIYAISEDPESNLWIGTKGGLNKYVRGKNTFERISYNTGFARDVTLHSYNNICLKNGNILINTPPVISIFDLRAGRLSHFSTGTEYDGAVKDVEIPVLEDEVGNIWAGYTNGLSKFSFQTKEFTGFPFFTFNGDTLSGVNVTALFRDKEKKLWAGTTTGLFQLSGTGNYFKEVLFQLVSGKYFSFRNCVRSIVKDKNGNMMIGTEGEGFYVLSENPNGKYLVQNYTTENSAIGHNIVQSLLIDRSENLWIGTLSGISKADLKEKKFKLYRRSNSPSSTDLLDNVIGGMFKSDDGILWIGNWGQGLNLVNPETNDVEHFSSHLKENHYLPNDFVHVIFKDADKNIWLGTRNGIFIYDKSQNSFVEWTLFFHNKNLPAFDNIRIYQIIQDRLKNYWIATSNGLYKINPENSEVEVFQLQMDESNKISANLVYSLLEDSEGLIWIATIGGLDVYNPSTQSIKHYYKTEGGLTSDFVISLCEDQQGRIWIGTNAFINIFDKKTQQFFYFDEQQGLPSNYIYEIIEDKNHDLWFATGNGLCRFDIGKNELQIFTQEDGLQSLEFNLRAAYASPDGELLFGGMNGFNSFYPDSLAGNPYVPNLVFTSFQTTSDGVQKEINTELSDKIILHHKVNSFTVEFAALEFTNPQKNSYAYQMKGVSDEWVNIGNRKFVPFFALPPGEYTFSVKGSNNDGLWNNDGIDLQIVVLPPWWRSNYAYLVYVFLIVAGIFVFIKLRERRLRYDKLLLEKKVFERTIQIEEQNRIITAKNQQLNELNKTKDKFFSIIGHDLRNHFNIIIGFSENLLSGFKNMDEEKREHHITNIHKSSVLAHDLLGNLLTWARLQRGVISFNPEQINVAAKIRELLRYHEEAALKKNILVEVFAKEEICVRADVNMFSTIIRNLLANAIKFTHNDGEISVQIKKAGEFCKIAVKDSGIGIAKENQEKIFRVESNFTTPGTNGEKGTGLGLVLCKEFVNKHGGKIWVESEIGVNSRFVFTLPLS